MSLDLLDLANLSPSLIHEYRITKPSLHAAMSVGLETNDIIQVLGRLSKIPLPARLQQRIADWTSSYGKIRLVLKHNRYFLESVDQKFLVPLMNDPVIAGCRVEKQNEEGQQVHGLERGTAPAKDLIIPGGAESRGETRHENDIIGAVIGLDRGMSCRPMCPIC